MSSAPNLLVIVLDCVRQSDFPGGRGSPDGMPFTSSIRKEFVEFPRAVSPAPWTLPSHVSLLTGEYPWVHGVHGKGSTFLPKGTPGIAPVLGELGYESLLASHNWFVSPEWGLGEGFQTLAWGSGYSLFLRMQDEPRPPHGSDAQWKSPDELEWLHSRNWTLPVRRILPEYLSSNLRTWDALTRIGRAVNGLGGSSSPVLGPWIEPTIERWLAGAPAGKPVFCFVNLLDAHEPYLLAPGRRVGLGEWFRLGNTRADRQAWMFGRWRPTAAQAATLHQQYRDTIRLLDARIERIIRAFQAAGRWDNSVCVITSDHGQAFGENGHLFHGFRAFEPVVRVPLWVRWPHAQSAGARAKGWASLVDVPATLTDAAGGNPDRFYGTVPLSRLVDRERDGPVFAMGDGIRWGLWATIPADRKQALDQLEIAAFRNGTRQTAAAGGAKGTAVELDDLGYERPGSTGRASPEVDAEILAALEHVTGSRPPPVPPEIGERLAGWGY